MADKESTDMTEEREQGTEAAEEEEEFTFAEDPVFEIEDKGECAYEVKVTVPVANETEESKKMFGELKDEIELPGFRKGRAPIKLVEKKFSKVVKGDVERRLVAESIQKLIKDEDFKPIGTPDVDGIEEGTERAEGEALSFTLKFEVSPKVELGTYRGLEIERPVLKIDEAQIDEAIKTIQERQAQFETLADGVAAQDDQVVVDFEGKIDGKVFQGGEAEAYPYILGSKHFFPEFETVLLGSSAGDELTCEITFPDDYSDENLCGQTADFTIKVNEIKRKTIPEMNDDLAKEAGYDDSADMRAKTGEQLKESAEGHSRDLAEGRALKAVVDASTFQIPKSMFEGLKSNLVQEEVERMANMRMPAAKVNELMDGIVEQAEKRALNNIKSTVVLGEIQDAEGIEVTDEDFETEAQTMASRYDANIDTVTQFMASDDQRSTYENRILFSKTMAVIMNSATLNDKEMDRETFDKQQISED